MLWRKFLHAPAVYEARRARDGRRPDREGVIPLVQDGDGVRCELFGQPERAGTPEEIEELEHRIRSNGMYPHLMSADELERVAALTEEEREAWFAEVMLETFERWMALAEERLAETDVRCFVMPGNDDPPGVDDAIERRDAGRGLRRADRRVRRRYTMISLGYSNITPFDSPRELEEDELYRRVEAMAEQVDDLSHCVFNLHVPPYESQLDTAAELDEELQVVAHRGPAADDPGRLDRGARADRALPAARSRSTGTSTSRGGRPGSGARSASTRAATTTRAASPACWSTSTATTPTTSSSSGER